MVGLSVLLSYANQYMKPFNDISSVITEMQNALACADRIFDLLEQKEETPDAEGVFATVDGNVTIGDVAFSYDKEKELIKNFNLDVKPGMRIAIVGPTGCGKTTFINLLMRFYDVDEGKSWWMERHPGSIQTCAQKQLWHGTAGYLDQERNRERQHLFWKAGCN